MAPLEMNLKLTTPTQDVLVASDAAAANDSLGGGSDASAFRVSTVLFVLIIIVILKGSDLAFFNGGSRGSLGWSCSAFSSVERHAFQQSIELVHVLLGHHNAFGLERLVRRRRSGADLDGCVNNLGFVGNRATFCRSVLRRCQHVVVGDVAVAAHRDRVGRDGGGRGCLGGGGGGGEEAEHGERKGLTEAWKMKGQVG